MLQSVVAASDHFPHLPVVVSSRDLDARCRIHQSYAVAIQLAAFPGLPRFHAQWQPKMIRSVFRQQACDCALDVHRRFRLCHCSSRPNRCTPSLCLVCRRPVGHWVHSLKCTFRISPSVPRSNSSSSVALSLRSALSALSSVACRSRGTRPVGIGRACVSRSHEYSSSAAAALHRAAREPSFSLARILPATLRKYHASMPLSQVPLKPLALSNNNVAEFGRPGSKFCLASLCCSSIVIFGTKKFREFYYCFCLLRFIAAKYSP